MDSDDEFEVGSAEGDQWRARNDDLWSQLVSMYVSGCDATTQDNEVGRSAFIERYMDVMNVVIEDGPRRCAGVLASACEMATAILLEKYGSYANIFAEQERRAEDDILAGVKLGPTCPHCGVQSRHALPSDPSSDGRPGEGDRIVCAHCLRVSVFTEVEGHILTRVPTEEEQAQIDEDPELQKWLAASAVTNHSRKVGRDGVRLPGVQEG